jgi:hypothetical protein
MAEQMMSLRSRWMIGLASVLILSGAYGVLDAALVNSLRSPALVSGFVLFIILLLLTLFNARKKLPFLPLVKASAWLQFHIYAGIFAMILFLFHIRFKVPQGKLEVVLTGLFLAVSLSGLIGLGISRWVPPRLTLHGENLIFERIPVLRKTVKEEVERLVLSSVRSTDSTTIADFYQQSLHHYFERPRFLWSHLLGYSGPLHRLLSEIAAMDRYLNPEEKKIISEVTQYIQAKDNLDFQLAAQGLLKGWLFVHIPLTYALILVAVAHGILAWRFS